MTSSDRDDRRDPKYLQGIMDASRNTLALYALIVVVVEAILGVAVLRLSGMAQMALIFGMILILVLVIAIAGYRWQSPREITREPDSDIDLDTENDIQDHYARVNGVVTETSENDADGSWRYEYNEYRSIYELDIQLTEYIDDDAINRRFETVGSRSGFWPDDEIFIHVAEMTESIGDDEYRVFVFVWGDAEIFEAVILPDKTENEEFYKKFYDLQNSELIDNVKGVKEQGDDIIYGETTSFQFE